MRAWLFVLTVLATMSLFHSVASTEEVKKTVDPVMLAKMENALLTMLGMRRRPNVDRTKIVIPEEMIKLYEEMSGSKLDSINIPKPGLHTQTANTMRGFTHEESKIDARFKHHHKFRLFFNVSNIPINEKLKAAELSLNRVAHNVSFNRGERRQQIYVYDIVQPGIKNKREPIFRLIDTKAVRVNTSDNVKLDVFPAVERWMASPKGNHGLLIQVVPTGKHHHNKNQSNEANQIPAHHHVRLRRSLDEAPSEWANKQPQLFTYTDDGNYRKRSIREVLGDREKRSAEKQKREKNRNRDCHRQSLFVDFSEVGWTDWIVAPPGYDAYYCYGKCRYPLTDHMNATNHATVQTLIHNIYPTVVPKSCCVPTELTSISMLYLDEQNKVVLKNYQDMAVVSCGCA